MLVVSLRVQSFQGSIKQQNDINLFDIYMNFVASRTSQNSFSYNSNLIYPGCSFLNQSSWRDISVRYINVASEWYDIQKLFTNVKTSRVTHWHNVPICAHQIVTVERRNKKFLNIQYCWSLLWWLRTMQHFRDLLILKSCTSNHLFVTISWKEFCNFVWQSQLRKLEITRC